MQKTNEVFKKEENGFLLTVYKIQGGYSAVIRDSLHALWRKDFSCPETAQSTALTILRNICLTVEYLSLSEKYYKESRYYQSVGDEEESEAYMKKAFFYKEKYQSSKGLEILS
jgi:hypothetical protein